MKIQMNVILKRKDVKGNEYFYEEVLKEVKQVLEKHVKLGIIDDYDAEIEF